MNIFKVLLLAETGTPTTEDAATETFGKIASELSNMNSLLTTLAKMVMAAVIAIIVIQIYRAIYRRKWKKSNPNIKERFLYNIVLIVMYISSVLMVLAMLPEGKTLVFGIISSTGFIALGIGLAAQESLSNVVNGMMISISKPFEVGDRIHLVNGKITGYVEDITLRHTVIKTFVNSRVIVPNSTINKDMIENSNYQQGRASSFIDVVVIYDSDIDQARDIMAKIIGSHPNFVDLREPDEMNEPKVKVFIRELGINGVGLRASMWTSSTDNNFEASSDARYKIFKKFQEKNILLSQVPPRPEFWLPDFDITKRKTNDISGKQKL